MQRIVSAYLDMAEMQAMRKIPMTMADWEQRLSGLPWNRWPLSRGISGQFGVEYALPGDDTSIEHLVYVNKMRWRIERDYRELKQEFGLGQYEGRNWRGLHHHATLYRFARQKVDVRVTASTVEVFKKGERLASHPRSLSRGRHPTADEHLAPAHQKVAGWNSHWHDSLGDPTLADASLDRLVHHAHHLDLAGESLRRLKPKLTKETAQE